MKTIKKKISTLYLNEDLKKKVLKRDTITLSNLFNRAAALYLEDEVFNLMIHGCSVKVNNSNNRDK